MTKKTPRTRELANRRAAAKRAGKPATMAKTKPETVARSLKALGAATRDSDDQTRWPAEITVGTRFRLDKGDIRGLAQSINRRGGLIQPIAIDEHNTLIDGERRLLAWQHEICKYRDDPIPVHVIDIDSIVAGEYDANTQRKGFTPSETVAIKRALEPRLKEAAKERQREHGGTAPGRRKQGKHTGEIPRSDDGRAAAAIGKLIGKDRRTIEKAEKVVEAAEREPEKYGKLKEDMDRTGRVDGPFKRLQIIEATRRIRTAPPPLPGNGPYTTMVIDYPWPFEGEAEQDEIDARGRSLRPYPAMSIKSGCHFLRDQVAPLLAPDCTVWFWATNHDLVKGYAHQLIAALGFAGRAVTMLTWCKDKIGRGQVLREVTEQCILLKRGNPVINVLGENPPTTLLRAPRRENSRKPDEFYRLVERVTPAPRYASIFSTGGEGELWDGHGDQVGKHAPPAKSGNRPADDDAGEVDSAGSEPAVCSERDMSSLQLGVPSLPPSPLEGEGREGGNLAPNDAIGAALQTVTEDSRGTLEPIAQFSDDELQQQKIMLETIQRDGVLPKIIFADMRALLERRKWIEGKRKLKLTDAGQIRLGALRMKFERAARDQVGACFQVDHAVVVDGGDPGPLPEFLRRGADNRAPFDKSPGAPGLQTTNAPDLAAAAVCSEAAAVLSQSETGAAPAVEAGEGAPDAAAEYPVDCCSAAAPSDGPASPVAEAAE